MALLLKEITTERISKQQFAEYLKNDLLPFDENSKHRSEAQKLFSMFGPYFSVHVACALTHGIQATKFSTAYKLIKKLYYENNLNDLDVYKLSNYHIGLIREKLQICAAEFETQAKQRKQMPVE
jgi:hypothetical protein